MLSVLQWAARPRVLVPLILALALASAVGLALSSPPRGPVRRLPDGSTLELAGITPPGREVRLGPRWRHWVRALFPSAPVEAPRLFTDVDGAPVVWFLQLPGARSGLDPLELAAADDAGSVLLQVGGLSPNWGAEGALFTSLEAWPRRSEWIELRVYGRTEPSGTGIGELARFRVPNPGPSRAAPWAPDPSPPAVAAAGSTVRLARFVTAASREDPSRPPAPGTLPWSHLELEETPPGRSLWEPLRLLWDDASGNRQTLLLQETPGADLPKGRRRFSFRGALPEAEGAYRLSVELGRTRNGPFPAEDLWTVGRIPLPPRGRHYTEWPARMPVTRRYGGEFWLRGIEAPSLGQPHSRVWVEVPRAPDEAASVVLLSARDDHGRTIPLGDRRGGRLGEVWHTELRWDRAPRWVDVTLAVSRTVRLEGRVRPERPH